MKNLLTSLFGSRSERALAPYRARLGAINKLADATAALSDDDLRRRMQECRERRANGEPAQKLQTEVFSLVREGAWRALGMRHFDEQLLGGMALFDGNIAEMKTGEGKTLVATLPVCLEALSGDGVHVVTVNDYLATRDADWMGQLYRFLGFSVGANIGGLSTEQKRAAYDSDITYGTNNEFGFDYLRHNMRYAEDARVMRALNFAIVDEVDSILIDEARTPLIISGEAEDNVQLYTVIAQLTSHFKKGTEADPEACDFTLDEKTRTVQLTERGFETAERVFAKIGLIKPGDSLYAPANLPLMHHLDAALRARHLFLRDRDYVVQDGQVIIVDEFTGRLMPGRRWGDNQHQAVEAKEKVAVQKENRTLASISFQNYFRLYKKLAGMTGTAMTEAQEFEFIYGLKSVEIPTHQTMIRKDDLDKVFQTAAARDRAVLQDIADAHQRGQPVLVGTTAIEASEKLSAKLKKTGLPHNVLNAKQHGREAAIIAQAGKPGAITIATNMAGRGTDILLGGNLAAALQEINDSDAPEEQKAKQREQTERDWQAAHDQVVAAGGLRIIGTERHESRRVDNQLRGRSGRQGDPGSSIFYLSFSDALLRIFATGAMTKLIGKMDIPEDEPIEARMVSRTIENAQRKVEAHNFDVRRQLLEYDDIANEQRRLIYQQRETVLTATDLSDLATEFRVQHLEDLCNTYLPPDAPEEEWRAPALEQLLAAEYRLKCDLSAWMAAAPEQPREHFVQKITDAAEAQFAAKFTDVDAAQVENFMRMLILNIIDDNWRKHLSALDALRQSIGFRGVAQKNPKQEYKREAFDMFSTLLGNIQSAVSRVLYSMAVRKEDAAAAAQAAPPAAQQARHDSPVSAIAPAPAAPPPAGNITVKRAEPKIGRNAPCPCGSGKKYKQCCGKLVQ